MCPGTRWVTHNRGVPTGEAQVSNFGKQATALAYARDEGFTVVGTAA
jgi:hypothetical protein